MEFGLAWLVWHGLELHGEIVSGEDRSGPVRLVWRGLGGKDWFYKDGYGLPWPVRQDVSGEARHDRASQGAAGVTTPGLVRLGMVRSGT